MATPPSQRFGVARDTIAPAGAGRDARAPQSENSHIIPDHDDLVERQSGFTAENQPSPNGYGLAGTEDAEAQVASNFLV